MVALSCAVRPATISLARAAASASVPATRIDAFALLRQAGGHRIGAHIDARAGFVDGGDLVFEHAFQRAQPREGAIETGIERIELAAHGAAEPGGGARSGFVGREQPVGDFGQRLGGLAHGLATDEGPGRHHQQRRRRDGGKAQQRRSAAG